MICDIKLKRMIHEKRPMATLGSSVFRVLQNTVTNELDLLVRESIQNSLDAGFFKKEVHMDFSVKKFNSYKFLDILEGVNKDVIKEIFSNEWEKHLVISDSNTQGLTGNIGAIDTSNSNIFKLIYNIGEPQTEQGAGGSWGYGKSIFYRIALGFVLFYSRIKLENNTYEERLVVCLIEDENKKEKIAQYSQGNDTGISWWGDIEIQTNVETNESKKWPVPLTDVAQIEKILKIFGIRKYDKTKTGTIICIPYIDEEKLLKKNNPNNDRVFDNVSDYIEESILKWYAPRINNTKYSFGKKNNLLVTINEKNIYEEYQFFKLLKEMYNFAISKNIEIFKKVFPNIEIYHKTINVARNIIGMVGQNVGDLVYVKATYKDLGYISPSRLDNPINLIKSSTQVLDIINDTENPPIILMTRQPGMIINYFTEGIWTKGLPSTSKNEYIIGFFVLNSNKEMGFETNLGLLTLEEYIRQNEKPDHMEWQDGSYVSVELAPVSPSIVRRIQDNITRTIRSSFVENDEITRESTTTDFLKSELGKLIMPPIGFGNRSNVTYDKNNKKEKIIKTKTISYDIKYEDTLFSANEIIMPFNVNILEENLKILKIQLAIQTEIGVLNISKYELETNKISPLGIKSVQLYRNLIPIKKDEYIIKDSSLIIIDRKHFKLFEEDKLTGVIVIYNEDKNFSPIIRIEAI